MRELKIKGSGNCSCGIDQQLNQYMSALQTLDKI